MNALEEERRRVFLVALRFIVAADGRQTTADECAAQFVDQPEAVPFVCAKRKQRDRLVRIGGRVPVLVHGAVGWKRLAFALELLDAAHGDGRGGPVDHDWKSDGLDGRKAP